jgi:glyoxylase-like metal-dependent hydrolase (beta-lactamase superfamily II)
MIEEIKPNLFVFYSPNSGSNAYILVGRKIALVDASSQGNTGDLGSALASIGLAPDQVDLVLFTHGHADHFSGAEAFGRAKLRMHKLDADYVNNKDEMFTAANILGSSHFPKIGSFLEP